MALEYTTNLIPVKSLDEAIDQKGIILFGLNSSRDPALLSPEAFKGAVYSGDINGPYDSADMDKIITYGQVQYFFGPNGRGPHDYRGAQGVQGTQGPSGDGNSLRGYQGIQGEAASDVAQGVQGYQGYQGIQGLKATLQGPKGKDGVLGPNYQLTWDKLKEVFAYYDIYLSDNGSIEGPGLKSTTTIESVGGFYQGNRD